MFNRTQKIQGCLGRALGMLGGVSGNVMANSGSWRWPNVVDHSQITNLVVMDFVFSRLRPEDSVLHWGCFVGSPPVYFVSLRKQLSCGGHTLE